MSGDPIKARESRGLAWVAGAFVFCPCHLPLTLALLTALLSGTAAAVVLRENIVLAGALISLVWAAGTARGAYLIRSAKRGVCEIAPAR